MSIFKYDHIHLRSTDAENMTHYFETMFNATITNCIGTSSMYRLIINLDGLTLFIDQAPDGTTSPPAPPNLGIEHIGLTVSDFDAAIEKLTAKGAEFSVEPHSPREGLKLCFLRGPHGITIEILERSIPG